MSVHQIFVDFVRLREKILNHSVSFVKHLTTVGATMLAVMIVLPGERAHNSPCLTAGFLLLTASVLSGTLYLWLSLKVLRKTEKLFAERIWQQLQTGNPRFEVLSVPDPLFWKTSERLAYLLFALSMICLAVASFY